MHGWYITALVTLFLALVGSIAAGAFWAGKIQEHKGIVEKFMAEIGADIKKILERLPPNTSTHEIPVKLPELGETVSSHMVAKEWAKEAAWDLVDESAGKKEYEILRNCQSYVQDDSLLNSSLDCNIAEVAYEHGIREDQVRDVFAIELRDALLAIMAEA